MVSRYNIFLVCFIAAFGVLGFVVVLTVVDMNRTYTLSELNWDKLRNGYDVVCDKQNGIQGCVFNYTDSNSFEHIRVNKTESEVRFIAVNFKNDCLNLYLKDGDKVNDIFNQTDSFTTSDGSVIANLGCEKGISFAVANGWSINKINTNFQNNATKQLYFFEGIGHWWEGKWFFDW